LRIDQLQPGDGQHATRRQPQLGTPAQPQRDHHHPAHQGQRPGQVWRHRDQVGNAAPRRRHLGGMRDPRTEMNIARQQHTDAATQDAEHESPAAQQAWPEELRDEQPHHDQQGSRGRQPRGVIEPGTGGPTHKVCRPEIPGIQENPGHRFRGKGGMEEPGAVPAVAPHRLVDEGIASNDDVAAEDAARRARQGGHQDRRHGQRAHHRDDERRPSPADRIGALMRLCRSGLPGPARERHQAARRTACLAGA